MYTLRVLGTVDLRGPDGRRVGSLLSQPKRLSLLALLAIEAPRRLQRDEVVGRLWPDMTDERARNALRQALHYLRRSLGPGVIAGKGEEGIGVAQGKLECDAADLLRAAAEGRYAEALDLYGGELLPGFHLDGGPREFEEWLDDARRRVQRAAAEAAGKVAEEEAARGNAVAAGAAVRKAFELGDPGEPAFRTLLELLVRTGDVSGARAAYEDFAARLRQEHGTEPSASTREIIEKVAAEPRSTAGPSAAAEPGTTASHPLEKPVTARGGTVHSASVQSSRAWWTSVAAALAAAVVAGSLLLPRAGEAVLEGRDASSGHPSLYLEPIRDLRSDDPSTAMAEAVTTELAARLSETNGFIVVAVDRSDQLVPGHGVLLRSTLRDVGGQLQLSVLLLDPSSDAVLERLAVTAEEGSRGIPELLSGRLAPRIRQSVGDLLSLRGLAERGIEPRALAAIRDAAAEVKGADDLRVRGATEAAALAYVAADSLLRRAASVEEDWAEPTLRRAELALHTMWLHLIPPHRNLELAHREVLKGLSHADQGVKIAPEDPRGWETRGILLYWASQTTAEKEAKATFLSRAEDDLQAALSADPGLPRAWSILSAMSEKRGDFAAAYHRARRAYVTDHDLRTPSDILTRLFTNGLEAGDAAGAAEWCREIRRQEPDHWLGPYCELTHRAWVGPWVVAESDSLLQEAMRSLPGRGPAGELGRRFQLLHAVVLARAGEGAAAREVLAEVDAAVSDPFELLDMQAWVRTALGENERARKLLAAATENNPEAAPRILGSRRYSELTAFALARNDKR